MPDRLLGEEIGSAVRLRQPDLVFVGWGRDGVEGISVCGQLVNLPEMAGVPILFLGESLSQEDQARGFQAGAAGFLHRPFFPELVRQAVGSYLLMRRQFVNETTARERAVETKNVIVRLLETASKVKPIRHQLEEILDILSTIPWLEAESQGAIFLTDDEVNLTIVASRGMPREILTGCSQLPSGQCLCGQAAATQRQCFIPNSEELSGFCGKVGKPRGIHILPLIREGRTLGLLLFHVRAGHHPQAWELAFMSEFAATVAALIAQRLMASVLEIRNYEIQAAQNEVIRLLGLAGEYRDNDTGLHVLRVAHYSRCIAEAAGLSAEDADLLFHAAPMHDIGKIGVPDSVLRKPGRLNPEEFATMQSHALIGEQILHGDQPLIEAARAIAGSHHENWDGSGYPRRLTGEEIPLFGRICALADVFDALGQDRPYKAAWKLEDILAYIRQRSGTQFDPFLVDAFFQALPKIRRFSTLYGDAVALIQRPIYLTPVAQAQNVAVPWKDAYSVGIPIIDEHHRYLFDLVNALYDALNGDGPEIEIAHTLKALENYTGVHFYEEESLMARYGYAGLRAHTLEHRNFVAQASSAWVMLRKNPLISAQLILTYLSEWLIDHVRQSDAAAATAILASIHQKEQPAAGMDLDKDCDATGSEAARMSSGL